MDSAVMRLKNRLSASADSYGFFFYAGHGVQAGGENFLIPVNANIPGENYLKGRAVSVQLVLDELNDARNTLNVVVLVACRDNPFGWARSGTRGLSIISRQPAGSIVVYATSAGMRASDGEGRNGLFTSQLLTNLKTPGLDVSEVFRRTGANVSQVSANQQVPAIYNQFFGIAYLGGAASGAAQAQASAGAAQGTVPARPTPQPLPATQEKQSRYDSTKLWSVGASLGSSFAEPWFIGTVRGTLAPIRYVFFEVGFDIGLISGISDVSYYSLLPYAHAAYYRPFTEKIGAYAGAGGGFMLATYTFDKEGELKKNSFIADVIVGVNLFSMIDVSYTLRTNFGNLSNKFSVGYAYRFK
jgi:hypothetical protein